MKEIEVIKEILNTENTSNGSISTLTVAIRGVRELDNRDLYTGKKNTTESVDNNVHKSQNNTFAHYKFLVLANYLIIIDLIGNIFTIKGKNEIKGDRFKQTLQQFTSLENDQINSIKNLRNSLAHNFSLGNDSEIFSLDYANNFSTLIKPAEDTYPITKRKDSKTEKNYTKINYEALCDLVEQMYIDLKSLNESNKLQLISRYKDGDNVKINDIRSKYFIK